MDPSTLALLGSAVLIVFLLCLLAAIVYVPYTFAQKMLRGLIRSTRSTIDLIRN